MEKFNTATGVIGVLLAVLGIRLGSTAKKAAAEATSLAERAMRIETLREGFHMAQTSIERFVKVRGNGDPVEVEKVLCDWALLARRLAGRLDGAEAAQGGQPDDRLARDLRASASLADVSIAALNSPHADPIERTLETFSSMLNVADRMERHDTEMRTDLGRHSRGH